MIEQFIKRITGEVESEKRLNAALAVFDKWDEFERQYYNAKCNECGTIVKVHPTWINGQPLGKCGHYAADGFHNKGLTKCENSK